MSVLNLVIWVLAALIKVFEGMVDGVYKVAYGVRQENELNHCFLRLFAPPNSVLALADWSTLKNGYPYNFVDLSWSKRISTINLFLCHAACLEVRA